MASILFNLVKTLYSLLFLVFIGCSSKAGSYSSANCSLGSSNSNVSQNIPSNICAYRTRPIRVGVDPKFTTEQVEWIRDSLTYLSVLGITATIETTNIDVTIVRWNNTGLHGHCENGRMGEYLWGTNYVNVDPDCSTGQQQFEVAVEHELCHWLGMHHVCREDGRTSDTCSNVGRGVAIMNPYLDIDHNLTPSNLDILEYERAYFERCLNSPVSERRN
jgi:hypothetical protein